MNHVEERSPEQIQSDIRRTRSHLDETLTALERRLQPGRLVDQGVDYLRDNGAKDYLVNLGRAAQEQPLPLALAGVGLAWLMLTNGRARTIDSARADSAIDDALASAGDTAATVRDKVTGAREQVAGFGDQVARKTREAAQHTSQAMSNAAQVARERAQQIGSVTRQGAERVRSSYEHVVSEQPLALGAIGLAVGALLAATAPRTRQEDRLMGSASDRLADQAKTAGLEQLEKAKNAASAAQDAVVEDLGADPDGASDYQNVASPSMAPPAGPSNSVAFADPAASDREHG